MSDTNKLPLELYRAHLELQIKLGKLLRESGTQLVQRGQQLANERSEGFHAELQKLKDSDDWQTLATQSAAAFWQRVQQQVGDNQTLAQISMEVQTDLARNVQNAVQDWQQKTAEAFAGLKSSDTSPWGNLLKPWEQLLQSEKREATMPAKPSVKKDGVR